MDPKSAPLRSDRRYCFLLIPFVTLIWSCTTNNPSGGNNERNTTPDDPAPQPVQEVTSVAVEIEPEGSGDVLQTDLGSSRIQLFAVPSSEEYVFDHWEGLATKANPVTIVGRDDTGLTAVFVKKNPRVPTDGNSSGGVENDNFEQPPLENDNDTDPPIDNIAPTNDNNEVMPPVDSNDNEIVSTPENDNIFIPPAAGATRWIHADQGLLLVGFPGLVTFDLDESGHMTLAQMDVDEDALTATFLFGGEGEGEGEGEEFSEVELVVLNTTASPGAATEVFELTVDGLFGETMILYTQTFVELSLDLEDDDSATLTFDVTQSYNASFDIGPSFESILRRTGALHGTISADSLFIDWISVEGTQTTTDGFGCNPVTCSDDLADLVEANELADWVAADE